MSQMLSCGLHLHCSAFEHTQMPGRGLRGVTSLPCSLRQADGRRSTRAAARAAARVAAEQNPRPDSGQPAKKDSNIRGNKEHASPILLGLAMAAAAADAIMPVARGLASAVVSGMAAGSTVGGTVVMRRDEGSSTASPALSARQAGTWPPSPAAVQGAQVLAASRLGGAGRQLHVATARAGTASAAVGSASEQSALHHTEPEADQAAASISPAPGAPVALPVVPSRTTLRVLSGGSAAPPAAAADEPAAAAPSNAAPKATPSSAPAAAAPSTTPAATMPGRTPLEVVPTAPSTLPDVPAPEGPTSSITGGNGGMLEGLLQTLAAAAADAKGDGRSDPVRALLAAAPASGEPRTNFARSLVRGMEEAEEGDGSDVFVLARTLLERALEGGHLAPAGSSLPATAAAPVPAAASSVPSTAGASGGAATGGSGGGSGKYDELLKALAAAAASSDLELDSRFDPVRALLASAPERGERRDNFARSLLLGIDGVQGGDYTSPFALAKILLERALESGSLVPGRTSAPAATAAPSAGAGSSKYEALLQALTAAAASPELKGDGRFDPVRALLAAAPTAGQPRDNFARNLLRGIEELEDGDSTSVFALARTLLTRALDGGGLVPAEAGNE